MKKWKFMLALVLAAMIALAPCANAALNKGALDALMQKKTEETPAGGKASVILMQSGGKTEVIVGVVEEGLAHAVHDEAGELAGFDAELVKITMTKAKYETVRFVSVSAGEALQKLNAGEVTLLMGYRMNDEMLTHVAASTDISDGSDETDTDEIEAKPETVITVDADYIASDAYLDGKKQEKLLDGTTKDFGNLDYYLIGTSASAKIISDFNSALERADIDGDKDGLWKKYFEMGALFSVLNAIRRWFRSIWRQFRMNLIDEKRYNMILNGLGSTMLIALCAAVLGVFLGCVLALMRLAKNKLLNTIASIYVDVIRGTPVVVQLMIMYYVIITSPNVSKVMVSIITFGINSGAYVSEMVRGGILAIDKGQTEAGRSLGLSAPATMMLIILPQTIKIIIPSLFNEIIALLKETSVVGFIGLMDLTKAGDIIRSRTFSAFFPLLAVAAVYLIVVTVFTRLFNMLERKMRQSDIR